MEEFNTWLQKAQEDLKWTQHNLNGSIWYGACFTAQQVAEKSLKAYLLFHKIPLRKIHDLSALLEECIQINREFETLHSSVSTLASYYITTRYPVYEDLAQFSKDQAHSALQEATSIFSFVSKQIRQ